MPEFKVGMQVKERSTGDIGKITRPHADSFGWWVLWQTGEYAGLELWIGEGELTVSLSPNNIEDEDILSLAKKMCTHLEYDDYFGECYSFSDTAVVKFARTLLEKYSSVGEVNEANKGRDC